MTKHALRLMFFSGFYNSIHDSVFDFETDMILEDYPGKTWYNFRWTYDWNGYARSFVNAVNSEIGLNLEFRNLWSPREYNFATDEIYCLLDADGVKKISSALNSETLKKLIKERFTSRDGFISFYSNDINEWKEEITLEWDEIELGTLLDAWLIDNDFELDNLDYAGYEYCSCNGQWVDYEETGESKQKTEEENEHKAAHEIELKKLENWTNAVKGW